MSRHRGGRGAFALAAFILAAATIGIMGSFLLTGGDQVLSDEYSDLYSQFIGWSQFTFGEIARGNLPLWNPHLYCGTPWLGGFQQAMLYPPQWLHLVLPLRAAINWGIALHVFLCGLFTYLWMERRGLHPAAAIVAGLVFMFGGGYFLHITPGHLPNLRTMAWAPLIFLAIDDITTTRPARGAWIGAGAVAMQILAGHPQYVYYTAMLAGLYAVLNLWNAPARKQAILGLLVMGAGGAALAAIQLFTGLAAARESMRSHLPIELASTFALPPENVLTLVMPDFFGAVANATYWGRWYLPEMSLFMGPAAFALALYGAACGKKRRRRFAVTMVLVSLIVAFGSSTPLYRLLYRALPGFGSFRGVSKCAFLAMLFLANLAAVGLDRLLRAPKISRLGGGAVAAGAALLAAAGAALWTSGNAGKNGVWGREVIGRIHWTDAAFQGGIFKHGPIDPQFPETSAHAGAMELFCCAGAGILIAALWFAACVRDRRWALGIAVLAGLQLLLFASNNLPGFNLSSIASREAAMTSILRQLPPDGRVASDQPCFVLAAGGNEAWGNDPMVLRRYVEFMTINQQMSADDMARRGYPFFNRISPTWGMIRLKAVWMKGSSDSGQAPPLDWGLHPQWITGAQLPRTLLIENVKVIKDTSAMLAELGNPNFDPFHTVLLEEPIFSVPPGISPRGGSSPGTVTSKDLSTDQIEVQAEIARPCVLLMTDNFSNGWHIRPLNAPPQRYEVIPADHALRGIFLTPGSHHFILEFRPLAYVVGKWTTLAALALYAIGSMILCGRRLEGSLLRRSFRKSWSRSDGDTYLPR